MSAQKIQYNQMPSEPAPAVLPEQKLSAEQPPTPLCIKALCCGLCAGLCCYECLECCCCCC
ncbi:uncharacterized protein GLRG_00028 [Colletotrichum graminicola M1.001]|uniref:Uncharacterized protein n=1 Tax=Colletotrichum graminicola (strain M1.001 / M2 / FGSC 10212) TaxID=645133 RepID=E3Q2Q5_COLGM|nr:uncharacterized protein GLRG_00028 [Colletotrichum graminicola M1.001]EFQ24884.1 hypothetical protein GLRG_00028 [Colletotrichum graminicola M1.001]